MSYTLLWTTLWTLSAGGENRREVGEVSESPMPDLAGLWNDVIASADVPTRAWLRRTQPLDMHGSTLMVAVGDAWAQAEVAEREVDAQAASGTRGSVQEVLGPPGSTDS